MSTYSADVLATVGLLYYWQFKEPSGTSAADSKGTNTGTYQGTVTLGQTGLLGAGGDTAVLLDGSTGYVSTSTSIASPGPQGPLALEGWFKTTSVAAGHIITFEDAQTGAVASSDRKLYVGTDGKVYFGIFNGSITTINSASAYNDGNWHHAVAVLASNSNMTLYVDGASVASNANTVAPSGFTGWWRAGGGRVNGWPNLGTVGFLPGTLGHAAIYNAALSAATVLDHYQAGTLTGPYAPAPPTVVTLSASSISATGGTLNATVNPNGKSTTAQFEWGTTTAYGNTVSLGTVGSDSVAHSLNTVLSGLTTGQTYHFRIDATNADGTSQGTDQTFTANAPTVPVSQSLAPAARPFNPYRLSLRVQTGNGETFRWGPDSPDGRDIPQDLEFTTSIPGGFKDLNCSLLREITSVNPDNNLLDSVLLYGPGRREAVDGRKSVFEGFFSMFPRHHGSDFSVDPGALGFAAVLGFFPGFQRIYVDRDATAWGDMPLNRKVNRAGVVDMGVMGWTSDGGGLVCAVPNQSITSAWAEAWYTAPPGAPIGKVAYIGADTALPAGWEAPTLRAAADDANVVGESYAETFDSTLRSRVLTTARGYALWSQRSSGVAVTPAVGSQRRLTAVAVYGNHGLTTRAIDASTPDGVYNCDVVADILAQTVAGVLNWTTGSGGSIEPNTVIVAHLAFKDPVTAMDALAKASGFGITPFLLPEWGVYDGRTFFWRSPNADRLCWQARLSNGAKPVFEGEQSDDVINGVIVRFSDPGGVQRTVGPPAAYWPTGTALADTTDPTLIDTTATNPVNTHSLGPKWDILQLSQPATTAGAIALGAIYLVIKSQPQRRGQIELTGLVGHPRIQQDQPVYKVRAGDWLQLTDSDTPELQRRIIATRYSHATRTVTCDIDNRPFTLDALLEALQADLVGSL